MLLNRNELLEKVTLLQMNVDQLAQEASELKALAVEIIEQNVTLQLENENLKKVIGKEETTELDTDQVTSSHIQKVKKPLASKDNLAALYREGFHICKGELFGKHRHGEDCLFCLDVLSD